MQWVRNPFSPNNGSGGKQQVPPAAADDDSTAKEETLLRIPGAVVQLVDDQSVELGSGEFRVVRLSQGAICIGTLVKVGQHLRWPLTKDEPTVKVDPLHYIFCLGPSAEENDDPGEILNYGVTFPNGNHSEALDSCLQHYSCFSQNTETRVDQYNSALAKGIAAGSAQIIKGIFYCSNAYSSQIRKGSHQFVSARFTNSDAFINISPRTKRSIRRAKKLSRMTENLSKNVVGGVVTATGSVSGPILKSMAGQKLFTMLPGEVLLASLDAFNKVLDAAEVAGKNALSATSKATTEIVTERFGEDAGEVTHDGFAVAGHIIGTAWNVAKIRKAINPATKGTISSTVLKNARRAK